MGIFMKSGILHTLKFDLHTLSCHFWLNLCPQGLTFSDIKKKLDCFFKDYYYSSVKITAAVHSQLAVQMLIWQIKILKYFSINQRVK